MQLEAKTICDFCSDPVEEGAKVSGFNMYIDRKNKRHVMHICDGCSKKLGILTQILEAEFPSPPPTPEVT